MTKIKVFLAALTVVFAVIAVGQTRKVKSSRDLFDDDLPSYTWTQEAWTGTDAPFLKIQSSVDNSLSKATTEEVARFIPTYQAAAERNPKDAQKQFKWAYAAYKAALDGYRVRSIRGDAQDLSFALDKAKSPQSYVYTRLRFLLAVRWKNEAFKLRPLAERLLKRNPNDPKVLYAARNTLQTGISKIERNQALIYTKRLAKLQPQAANSYAALGSVYVDMCLYGDDKSACDASIAAYRKFYSMNPKTTKDLDYGIKHWMKRVKEHREKLG